MGRTFAAAEDEEGGREWEGAIHPATHPATLEDGGGVGVPLRRRERRCQRLSAELALDACVKDTVTAGGSGGDSREKIAFPSSAPGWRAMFARCGVGRGARAQLVTQRRREAGMQGDGDADRGAARSGAKEDDQADGRTGRRAD